MKDAKWYASWIGLANAQSAEEKLTNLEAAEFIVNLAAELEIAKTQNQYISEVADAYEKDIEKLERERDFLLKYLTDSHWAACDICKHEPEEGDIHSCKRIREVKGAPCFEWRGVQENGGIHDL